MGMKLLSPEMLAKVSAWNEERRAFYTERVNIALQNEETHLPAKEVEGLAEFARRFEAGDDPTFWNRVQRDSVKLDNSIVADAKRIQCAYDELAKAIEESRLGPDIGSSLKKKGINVDDADRILEALGDVIAEMAARPIVRMKPGNVQKPRAAWAVQAWQALKPSTSMKAAGRILSFTLDGNYNDAENIYQALRNSEPR